MTLLVFIYVYRIDVNIERLTPCSNKHNLHLKNILPSNKSKQQSTFKPKQKYGKLLLQIVVVPFLKILFLIFDDVIGLEFGYYLP